MLARARYKMRARCRSSKMPTAVALHPAQEHPDSSSFSRSPPQQRLSNKPTRTFGRAKLSSDHKDRARAVAIRTRYIKRSTSRHRRAWRISRRGLCSAGTRRDLPESNIAPTYQGFPRTQRCGQRRLHLHRWAR
jgi:hypothetical protein